MCKKANIIWLKNAIVGMVAVNCKITQVLSKLYTLSLDCFCFSTTPGCRQDYLNLSGFLITKGNHPSSIHRIYLTLKKTGYEKSKYLLF